jgi:hybrid cluster-associated redox disulfide protein
MRSSVFERVRNALGGHTDTTRQNGGTTMATITKDTIVGDILDIAPETAPAFLDIGMHCLGCPASRNETVEEACMVHDMPVEVLVDRLNDIIAANRK